MVEIALRAATAADAVPLSTLDVAVWRDSYADILSPATLAGLDRSPFHDRRFFTTIIDRCGVEEWLWVVESAGAISGYCLFGACKETAGGHLGEVERIYLLPSLRGRGVGTRILAAAAHRLVDEGLAPIRTTVFVDNRRARRLYERLGARELGRRVAFEDQGRPVWECIYGWADPAPLIAASDHRAGKTRRAD